MPLTLSLTPARGGGGKPQFRTLDHGTLSIGRGTSNDWVLPDPDQHLSRTHCMIAMENGRFVLTDLSTNGMLINGAREPTSRGSQIILTEGDTIQLGDHLITVTALSEPGRGYAPNPFHEPQDGGRGGRGRPVGTRELGSGGPLDVDPLDDVLGNPMAGGGVPGFEHPIAAHVPRPTMRGEDPFDRVEAQSKRQSLDDDIFSGQNADPAWGGPSSADHADAQNFAFTPPKRIDSGASPRGPGPRSPTVSPPAALGDFDFDALLGDTPPTASPNPLAPEASPAHPVVTDLSSLDDLLGDVTPQAAPPPAPAPLPRAPAPTPPPAMRSRMPTPAAPERADAIAPPSPPPMPVPVPAPVSPPPPVAATAAGAGDDALLRAFLEGAGLDPAAPGSRPSQTVMREVGALFRALVEGTRDVLLSRTEVKREMRLDQTVIRAQDNNALKFSISPDEALAALLRPDRRGYMQPIAAVREAFEDIRSHELAVMAGVQTALLSLLKRFDPATLEKQLQKGMLDGILPGSRKARFWETFCATYKDIAREAADDFQSVFGREFARAYQAQVESQIAARHEPSEL